MSVSLFNFREISMSVQSALGELWVVEVPHIIRDEGWNAQHRLFVVFLFAYYRYENWMSVSFFNCRGHIDEFSICSRRALGR